MMLSLLLIILAAFVGVYLFFEWLKGGLGS